MEAIDVFFVFLKGILAGFAFGVPVGAVGLLTIRRTMDHGFGRGFAAGLSGSFSDVFYSLLACLGVRMVTDFLMSRQKEIRLFGFVLLIAYGLYLLLNKKQPKAPKVNEKNEEKLTTGNFWLSCLTSFLTALPFALLNPAAIVLYTTGLVALGVVIRRPLSVLALALGVLLGSGVWWFFLAWFTNRHRDRFDSYRRLLNVIFASILIVLAVGMLVSALL